jgi:hypothetical protein
MNGFVQLSFAMSANSIAVLSAVALSRAARTADPLAFAS